VSVVLYRGPSTLTGAPIVALATLDSSNRKTGPMIQTWILPEQGPLDAHKAGADDSVCGDCPRRRSQGGDCYVRLDAAPHSAWKAWVRDGKPDANWDHHVVRLQQEARDHGLRLGAYGDPAAVPLHVWQGVISALMPSTVTGYTHQWRAFPEFRGLVMASCDSLDDVERARELGWRCFVALPSPPDDDLSYRLVQCVSDSHGRTCEQCGLCNGATEGDRRASVWIAEHGPMSSAKARRSAALRLAA
jgi:hypothetical protein